MSARPPAWRTALFLAVMLGILAVTALAGWRALVSPIKAVSTPCNTQTISGTLKSTDVTVSVYNTGTKSGLAAAIQTQLQTAGFVVPTVGNKTTPALQTTIIGATVDAPEVKLVAGFFAGSTIVADGRTNHTVEVQVGDTYDPATFVPTAPRQIPVQTAVVCSPPAVTVTHAAPSTSPTTAAPTGTPTNTKSSK